MKKTRDILLVIGTGIAVLCNISWLTATINFTDSNIDLLLATSVFALLAWLILLVAAILNLFIKN